MNSRFLILNLFWCLWAGGTLRAQDTVVLSERTRWDSIYEMNYYTAFCEDPGDNLTVAQAEKAGFVPDTAFRPHFTDKYGRQPFAAWMRWYIRNDSRQPEELLLLFHRYSFLKLYRSGLGGPVEIHDTYSFFYPRGEMARRTGVVKLAPGETITLWGQMRNAYNNFAQGYPVVIRATEYESLIQQESYTNRYIIFLFIFFLGSVLFMGIHSLALYWFNNKRMEFLLYAFYAFAVFNFFLFKFDEYIYVDIIYSYFPLTHKYLNNPFSYLMFFAYFRFVRSFIDFKAIALWFYRLIRVTEIVLLSAFALHLILALFNFSRLEYAMFNGIRVGLILVSFIGIYLLFRSRNRLSLFIAVGSSFLIVGALLAMILTWILPKAQPGHPDPVMFMQIGILIELLCFTLGLSYKTSLMEKEKQETQQLLIGKLEENRTLQLELNTNLETRVEEQMRRIRVQQQEIEKDKELQLKLEFQKKLTEMELQLLKSQLNPHFYFNTLNNLYGLSMIAPVKAPEAILKLSDIMEYVIYDCRSEKVTLENELKFIRSYVDLERLRYDREEAIQLDVVTDHQSYEISPLLLIQFIENAFKHGMEQGSPDRFLNIRIEVADGVLHYFSENSVVARPRETGGVGLENVRKRLDMLYHDKHTLTLIPSDERYIVNLEVHLA